MMRKNYKLDQGKQIRYFFYSFFILLVLAFISVQVGTGKMSLKSLLNGTADFKDFQILFISRIPRTLAVILSGFSMAVAGLIMQMLVQNRFVEPATTGITESAGFGILIATILFPSISIFLKMTFAVIFAILGATLLMIIIHSVRAKNVIVVPLLGMTFSGVVGALATFVAWKYSLQGTLQAWYLGDFSGVIQGRYELLYIVGFVAILSYFFADMFTVASLGKNLSKNLGLNHQKTVFIGLGIVSIVSGITTIVAGSLPFLGIIVPNIVSIFLGDYARKSLPFVAILGAIFVLFADILSRTLIAPAEIPVGVVMGVIGSGVFLVMLLRNKNYAN